MHHHAPGIAIVELSGEHDLSTAAGLAEALARAAARSNVVVDLSDCSFIDSSVVKEFIKASAMLQARGERLVLAIPRQQQHIARIVELTRLRDALEITDSREAAISHTLQTRDQGAAASRERLLEPSPPLAIDELTP